MSQVKPTVSVPTAIEQFTNLNLSSEHVTTTNFMDLNVAKSMELVPKQSVNFEHRLFTRLEPLLVPTFGNAEVHNKAFFVPYRTIFPAWNDFYNDVPHIFTDQENGEFLQHVSSVPLISNDMLRTVIIDMFCTQGDSSSSIDTAGLKALSNYDIVTQVDMDFYGYNLTEEGTRVFRLLQSLGYAIDFNYNNEDTFFSALPLLALAKVYMDWYYPSQYVTDDFATVVNYLFEYDKTDYENAFNGIALSTIFYTFSKVNYDVDYFTGAWDNPVAPNDGTFSNVSIQDFTRYINQEVPALSLMQQTTMIENGTPIVNSLDINVGSVGSLTQLTEFQIHSLKKLTDYVKRNQLAGSRVLDRYLARFGVTLSAEKLKRSEYLGGYNMPLKFGDVTSTSATEDSPLGTFAGLGTAYGNGKISYTADEYGMFIVISSIVPKANYYQGAKRETLNKTRFDFWTPEFDNLSVQAIGARELFCPLNTIEMYNPENIGFSYDWNNLVFGFTSQYGHYKVGHDMITGDYRLGSKNTGREAWTLYRDLTGIVKSVGIENFKHDINFVLGTDSDQYKRIFATALNQDYFNVYHFFQISSKFPGKSLFDSYEFDNEDNSQKVNVENGGVKAN